jgi:DNA-binding FrmR family transcriptional regulator
LEEIAEAYLMHRLSEDQVEAFEEHYFACAECVTVIQRVAAYVAAMRAAALKLRTDSLRGAAVGARHGSS